MEDGVSTLPVASQSYYNFTLDFTSILNQWKLIPSHLNIFQPHELYLNYSGLVLKFSNLWNLRRPAPARQWPWDWDKLVEMGMDSERHGPSLDEIGSVLAETTWPSADSILEAAASVGATPVPSRLPPPPLPDYPGPWNYMFSGYTLGVLLMIIILHRIQNIIIPSRIPPRRYHRAETPPSRNATHDRRAYRQLPLGISIPWHVRFAAPLSPFTSLGRWARSSSRPVRSWVSSINSRIFPLDLTKTSTRLAVHLPTLYWLVRMLMVWGVLVLQTAEIWPQGSLLEYFEGSRYIGMLKITLVWADSFAQDVQETTMDDICWTTFLTVVTSFLLESFIKALDGVEAGFPVGGNTNANTSPLTILLYSFLLHLYSSPFTHSFAPPKGTGSPLPSRPDKHAVVTVAIPLVQLTLFHAMSVRKKWSSYRLVPTMITSALSLLHFHGALWSYYYGSGPSSSFEENTRIMAGVSPSATSTSGLPTKESIKVQMYIAQRQAHAKLYPILNYIPNVFETMMILTTLLTIVLNVVVQMVVRGRVDRVLNGLAFRSGIQDAPEGEASAGGLMAFINNLPQEEDFGVLLLRTGAATLEATGLRGWSNEVAPIRAPPTLVPRVRQGRITMVNRVPLEPTYGSVKVGRVGAGDVQFGTRVASPSSTAATSSTRQRKPAQRVQQTRGLRNEVRNVDLGLAAVSGSNGGVSWLSAWWKWVKELGRYSESLWAAFKGLGVLLWTWAWCRLRQQANVVDGAGTVGWKGGNGAQTPGEHLAWQDESDEEGDEEEVERGREARERVMYERFLQGESVSDEEEDDDYGEGEGDEEGDPDSDGSEGYESSESHSRGSLEEGDDPEREAFSLFVDLMKGGLGMQRERDRGFVMSRLIADERSPLTRRRWSQRQSNGDGDDLDDDYEEPRQGNHKEKESAMCVVCIAEVRDILCWPCRCLAMCDGCREAMSSRSAPHKHRCPCCRQLIEGYSKIYIP